MNSYILRIFFIINVTNILNASEFHHEEEKQRKEQEEFDKDLDKALEDFEKLEKPFTTTPGFKTQSEGFFEVYPWKDIKKEFGFEGVAYDKIKDAVIDNEKKYVKDYYACYHACSFETFLLRLLQTNLSKQANNWLGKDFYLLRNPKDLFDKDIPPKEFLEDYFFKKGEPGDFDHDKVVRTWLLAVNLSFASATDAFNYKGESALYFFTHNQSLLPLSTLFPFYIDAFKQYNPELFDNKQESDAELAHAQDIIKEYIYLKIKKLAEHLVKIKKDSVLFQLMIPKDIIDDCLYTCWHYGLPMRHRIEKIDEGWDSKLGFYYKPSVFLELMEKNPYLLAKENILNTFQGRIILKKKYFDIELDKNKRLQNRIKMFLFYTLDPNIFHLAEETTDSLAGIILKDAQLRNNKKQYLIWFSSLNIEPQIEQMHKAIIKGLNSSDEKVRKQANDELDRLLTAGLALDLNFINAKKLLMSDDFQIRSQAVERMKNIVKHNKSFFKKVVQTLQEFVEKTKNEQYNDMYQKWFEEFKKENQ